MKDVLTKFYPLLLVMVGLLCIGNIYSDDARSTNHLQSVVLGAGCFWGVEKAFAELPGVVDVESGYSGGDGVEPLYKSITKLSNRMNPLNHAEVVRVTFNSNEVSLRSLLEFFFELHDPTQINRQGNDVGTQYRSVIMVSGPNQKNLAESVLAEYQALLSEKQYGTIQTAIMPLDVFFWAEEYHQDYLDKNPNGYCPDHSTGIKFKDWAENQADNSFLIKGAHILVIEANGFCPYCKKFRTDITEKYQGSVPISFRTSSQLKGLEINTPTWATPTVIFLRDGKEEFGFQGYMPHKDFYRALGVFKLGNSRAFKVAFEEGTDPRYCREYQVFKGTPEGIFVDKLSGAPLFDTRDRYDSKTGWLSFTKAVDGAVYTRADNRFGMKRIEIRSVSSDIHLGHVFPDGPNGMPRYCINATVLDFFPYETQKMVPFGN